MLICAPWGAPVCGKDFAPKSLRCWPVQIRRAKGKNKHPKRCQFVQLYMCKVCQCAIVFQRIRLFRWEKCMLHLSGCECVFKCIGDSVVCMKKIVIMQNYLVGEKTTLVYLWNIYFLNSLQCRKEQINEQNTVSNIALRYLIFDKLDVLAIAHRALIFDKLNVLAVAHR